MQSKLPSILRSHEEPCPHGAMQRRAYLATYCLGFPCRTGHGGFKLDSSLSTERDLVAAVISRVYIQYLAATLDLLSGRRHGQHRP